VTLAPDYKGDPSDRGRPWKNSGSIRRAMLDPLNSGGRACTTGGGKPVTVFHDRRAFEHLMAIAELGRTKRVLLLCVEDELASCHVSDLVDALVKAGHVATAVEPLLDNSRPGAGWTECPCSRGTDWRGVLQGQRDARTALRHAAKKPSGKAKKT